MDVQIRVDAPEGRRRSVHFNIRGVMAPIGGCTVTRTNIDWHFDRAETELEAVLAVELAPNLRHPRKVDFPKVEDGVKFALELAAMIQSGEFQ